MFTFKCKRKEFICKFYILLIPCLTTRDTPWQVSLNLFYRTTAHNVPSDTSPGYLSSYFRMDFSTYIYYGAIHE